MSKPGFAGASLLASLCHRKRTKPYSMVADPLIKIVGVSDIERPISTLNHVNNKNHTLLMESH